MPAFEQLKALGIEQFQFHTPRATSFLRLHKLEKFGDDLTTFRPTVVEANKRKAESMAWMASPASASVVLIRHDVIHQVRTAEGATAQRPASVRRASGQPRRRGGTADEGP